MTTRLFRCSLNDGGWADFLISRQGNKPLGADDIESLHEFLALVMRIIGIDHKPIEHEELFQLSAKIGQLKSTQPESRPA